MHNLNPTRIIARRGRDSLILGALLLLAGLAAGGVGFLISLLNISSFLGLVAFLIAVALGIVGIIFMIRALTMRMENESALQVGQILERELDQRYSYIRNISRRGLGYIDALLIGPPGALVFRIVEKPGVYLNEGSDWLERPEGKPFVLSRLNATRECVNDVYALRNFLQRRNLAMVPVYAIVVFSHPNVQVSARQPVVPVADLQTLLRVMRSDFLAETRVDQAAVDATVKAVYE
ncbi:MAG: hypothetical protein IT323_00190 [Anaerolineae bacterium]|nr:hypothetical protein [Anaerolineae bacterium]